MHLFAIISLHGRLEEISHQHFPFVQFVFPGRSDLILIWWLAGWLAGVCRLMADNYCDQAGTNAVHHHHQECEDPLQSPPGNTWLPHNSFIIRNLVRSLTRPWPTWGLSLTMTPGSTMELQPSWPPAWPNCVCRLCDTVTACLMSVQMLSEDQDLAPYTAPGWLIFGLA